MVQVVCLDDMHTENIWFSGSKPSNYGGKWRCHAREERTDGGKWKIEQCSVGPETAKVILQDMSSKENYILHCKDRKAHSKSAIQKPQSAFCKTKTLMHSMHTHSGMQKS